MRWHSFSNFKYYTSAAIALVGLSAASTLLTDRVSMAQQPQEFKTKSDSGDVDSLEIAEKVLKETLGDDHPKLRELRARLEAARSIENRRRDNVRVGNRVLETRIDNDTGGAVTITKVIGEDGQLLTEEVQGGKPALVLPRDVLVEGPTEVRALRVAGRPRKNVELEKAIEKFKNKETSDADKAAAKEKIVSILGAQFDDDMAQRAKQIAELEKKVATLKEQVEKRKGAKDRMIDLRIELLMNESEGLGFPSEWSGAPSVSPLGTTLAPARVLTVPGSPVPPLPPVAPTPPVPPTPVR